MPLSTAIVGSQVGEHVTHVTPRRIMAYAAGLSDYNARYFDDTRGEPLVAPPVFGVTLDWPLQERVAALMQLDPVEARQAVHASHDMAFHRPVRAGDVLTTRGQVIGVEERSAGTYAVTRYETSDGSGEPVLTVYYGRLFRGVGATGEPRWVERPPAQPSSGSGADSGPGWTSEIPIAPGLPHVYSECADIYNPIHTELSVAKAAGLPDIILHGTATLALAAREVVDRVCGGDPARLKRIAARFAAMVLPGTTIRMEGSPGAAVDGVTPYRVVVFNASDQLALRDSFALVAQ
ncbi:MAG: MaoC family dehydratase N-terminal domain-containing protein [Chloroflexi bacterium]|nr:MaoC family dehydratase N-terminal domain-containing protein [Chloroflexota bacterium]